MPLEQSSPHLPCRRGPGCLDVHPTGFRYAPITRPVAELPPKLAPGRHRAHNNPVPRVEGEPWI